MESVRAPGTTFPGSAQGLDEEYSPLFDHYGGPVDLSSFSGPQDCFPPLHTENHYADEVITFSISRVQTQMRSPETPAEEKARALGLPLEYFRGVMKLAEENDEDSDTDKATDTHPSTPNRDNRDLRPRPLFHSHAERSASPAPIDRTSLPGDSVPDLAQERLDPQVRTFPGPSHARTYLPQIQTGGADSKEPRPWEYQSPPPPPIRRPPPPPLEAGPSQHSRHGEIETMHLDGAQEALSPTHPHRHSITRALMHGSGERKRTLSFSNLRKMLPDLPTAHSMSLASLLPSSSKDSAQSVSIPNTPTDKHFRWSTQEPFHKRVTDDNHPNMQTEHPAVQHVAVPPQHQLDGSVESLLSPTTPASVISRARSNSEGSLFISRRFSGVSAYDDVTTFSRVTEMSNSRFKALQDTFQNSTIKLPKLPTIRPIIKRQISPEKSESEASREAGEVGPGSDENLHHPHPHPHHHKYHPYQYTSINKLRHPVKGVEIETPQQRAHPILSHALSKAEGDLVILGGYRGSVLRSAKPPHRQVWVPIKVGLNLRKVDLEVGLTREDEERMEQTIIPDGILSHVGPIDICKRLLSHMKKCPNARNNTLRVHNYGYDWRLSPDLLSDRLIEFLESLECNHPDTPAEKRGATVIAHSLGGLITRHAVNRRPELFAGVVFAGTPQNCVNILGPLRNGDDVLLSSRVLTAQVNFTIRTSFALLPEDGRCFIQKHTNERYDLDLFDPEIWEEYHLSPCINPPLDQRLKDDRRKSIMGALTDTIVTTSRRSSWFVTGPAPGQPSENIEVRDSVDNLSQRISDKEIEAEPETEGTAHGVVGPSMKQGQNRPTVATTVTIPKDLAKDYLDRVLAEVLVFKRLLKFIPEHQENNVYPPHAFIFGKSVPTVYGARVANKEAIKYTDAFDDLVFAAGDGVVLASAAQLPEGYRCVKGGRVETDRGHVGLMGDLEGMGRCIEAVIDARRKGVGLGPSHARHCRSESDVPEANVATT